MQTEKAAKGTLAVWSEEWEKGLLSVRESEESPWLFFFFSILPPWPPANPMAAAVIAMGTAARQVPKALREENLPSD